MRAHLHHRMEAANAAAAREARAREAMAVLMLAASGGVGAAADGASLLAACEATHLTSPPPERIPFIDLEVALEFDAPVHVWIDSIRNVSSTVPPADRFLFLMEPECVTGIGAQLLKKPELSASFQAIFSHDRALIDALPRARPFEHGGTWIPRSVWGDAELGRSLSKNFAVSFICGAKKLTLGHRLRLSLWQRQDEIQCPKTFYGSGVSGQTPPCSAAAIQKLRAQPSAKRDALAGVMFHVAIENVSQERYFTEKILDCFLTRVVPVYWGCPNLGDYFDLSGVIVISRGCVADDDDDDALKVLTATIVAALNALSADDYTSRMEAIERNFEFAQRWTDLEGRMQGAIDAERSLPSHKLEGFATPPGHAGAPPPSLSAPMVASTADGDTPPIAAPRRWQSGEGSGASSERRPPLPPPEAEREAAVGV